MNRCRPRWTHWVASLLCAGSLAACGGSSDPANDPGMPTDIPQADVIPADPGPWDDSGPDMDLPPPQDTTPDPAGDAAPEDAVPDVAIQDAAPDAADSPDVPSGPYTRAEDGEPVSAQELADLTDLYLDLLRQTRYFDVLDERIHGWPRSDPQARYWYGTWWSGVRIVKQDGAVTYRHSADGADNNGMRTAPMLDAACFAARLWHQPRDIDLVRRMVRGFSSWMRAFDSPSHPEWAGILSRAAYPASIDATDGDRTYRIDYDLNHPGEPNGATIYIHVPDNPHWGALWAKNKRSKDDIGHMMQALALLAACTPDPDADTDDPEIAGLGRDIDEVHALYRTWSKRADEDGFRFASVAEDGSVYFPNEDLAYLWRDAWDPECEGALALRLYHAGTAGDIDCGDGISVLEATTELKNDFYQIQRSFHQAALAMGAWIGWDDAPMRSLLDGLAWRLDHVLALPENQNPPTQDRAELVIQSAIAGLPLTWREVRYVHDRVRQAHQAMVAGLDATALAARYDVFSPEVPDGDWNLEPGSAGLHWRHLGNLLGDCASPFRNPGSKPLLDCDRVRLSAP